MDIELDIKINQLGQNLLSKSDGESWFKTLSIDYQKVVQQRIVYFTLQMGGTQKDIEEAIDLSGLKRTFTPCQLLLNCAMKTKGTKNFSSILNKIIHLPLNERLKSFNLLLSLFRVVYRKKRNTGLDPQKYWWYRDLSDSSVLESIVKEHMDPPGK